MTSDPWMTAMRRGDFVAAWEISDRVLVDRCARGDDCSQWPRHLQYIWNGASFDGKHVLVRCYHGLGDTIQYARFLEPLHRRARSITLWAQPSLLGLLRHVRGIDTLLPLHDGAPEVSYDVDIELMEIAHALRVGRNDLAIRMPYIELPRPEREPNRELHVGIVWRSGNWDENRSIPAVLLTPLGDIGGVALHSLQYPPEPLPFRAHDLACRDIYMMAHRMLGLDLIISVDTMAAHLAGALGLPTWLLLNEPADWRWQEDRDTTPWYPSIRLFRRRSADWADVVDDVTAALRERAYSLAGPRP